jgi:hypothetical protein
MRVSGNNMKTIVLSIIISVFFISCSNRFGATKTLYTNDSLVSINLQDSNYIDHINQLVDTITKDGWRISYLVKQDSTKYADIYIRCSKEELSATFYGGDLLLFRPGFVPYYYKDTKTQIYFYHRCATSCQAFLTFSKDSIRFKDYSNIAAYDLEKEQIVYLPYEYYEKKSRKLFLNAVDLKRNQEKRIFFKGTPVYAEIANSMDSINFASDSITIYQQTFLNGKQTQEVKTISFR